MNHKNSYRISKQFPETIPYVYFIQHIPTGIWYIGSKFSKNANPNTFLINYFTSSELIHELMEKSTKSDFKTKIIKTFSTANEATSYEKRLLIKIKAVLNPLSANRDDRQEPSKTIHVRYKTRMISSTTTGLCIRIKEDMPTPDGFIDGNLNARKPKSSSRTWWYDPQTMEAFHLPENQTPEPHWLPGRGSLYKSNSTSIKAKGYRWITDGVINKMHQKCNQIPEGWSYGRIVTTISS